VYWNLIHTKPRLESSASQNLMRQGYEVYLPLITREKLYKGRLSVVNEPLFPRYLFVKLSGKSESKGWSPIRSTIGVSRIVVFGTEPAKVDLAVVERIRAYELLQQLNPNKYFTEGDKVHLTEGPFAGLDAVYQMSDGNSRAYVLIELLSKSVRLQVDPSKLRMAD
jgi:transcriptional antiterminator RfaH